MKSKLLLFAVLLVLGGCNWFPSPSAEVEVTRYRMSGDYVYIYYTLTNTGHDTIDYYQVWFDIQTSTGTFTCWTNGLDVLPGTTVSDWTIERVSGQVSGVTFRRGSYSH